MNDYVVICEGLTKQFGRILALNSVNLKIKKETIFGLLGPNGSGKSTIIHMLCGVLPPTDGTATVLGCDIRKSSEKIKHQIGYMSQKFSLYPELTALENLRFYGGVYGLNKNKLKEKILQLTELTGLTERLNQRSGTLSGGWKQRLALCCALLHDPDLFILDEPTAGVDPVSRKIFWNTIQSLQKKNITVIVTTHYMDEAMICDEIGFLYFGRILVTGKPQEIIKQHQVETLDDLFIQLVEKEQGGLNLIDKGSIKNG